MRHSKLNPKAFQSGNLLKFAAVAILLLGLMPAISQAQQQGQKTFASAEEASSALGAATQANDEAAMLAIFGPEGKQVVYSGDDVQDHEMHANFAKKYQEMHRLVNEPDGTTTLYIGAENWPAPIPLVHKGNVWYFDTEAGTKEILYRRVGRNEVTTIRVCQELVAAQKDFASQNHNEYAQRFFSDAGQHNGLYWKAADGTPQSPIGPLIAAAVAEGYENLPEGGPTPFHGYYFHILMAQGRHAPGGSKNYFVRGKMTGGFAFVAYPAEYRSSGVMTFIVGSNGVVYEKDLGKNTESIVKAMKKFDPDSSWHKSETDQEQSASEQK
jgi:type II secretory pathway pseudopilin PulG